ncbi:indolepyruvate oxidoreductase subunit beta [Lutimonas saemankumensis]|uniref:indolepyruvate oxidoreductase subunit beta n=1 Tax=Lutimonas saemankumensis TaxID=483016 RepID=UPI001CD29186|nr:indolepyruvate oxidoreductase subunit beta [Lutimonas saemankumensis]MCA0933776.1 indolepyruvate oxidoreductase subunit beta [Lutimonas saemankumensis]
MTFNIILSGVGGQGILTLASIIDIAALNDNLFVKQSEVHGMSQRGGAVQCHIRIADKQIYSDLIPEGETDLILSAEPMELLRHIPSLRKKGWIITDSSTFENIVNYPDKHELYKQIKTHWHHMIINAKSCAKDLGNSKICNMVLLGAASSKLPVKEEKIEAAINYFFREKSEKVRQKNIEAFRLGQKKAKDFTEFVY